MNSREYWRECISVAADECELTLAEKQLDYLAESAEGGHEHYGMAFYSPPASDRIHEIEREHKASLKRLQGEFDRYRSDAETAIKQALRVHQDDPVSIHEHGEVLRHGGRTERIQ